MHRLQIRPNNAQLEGTRYHSLSYILGLCSSMGMLLGTDRQADRHTHTDARDQYISRRLYMTHAKCNHT